MNLGQMMAMHQQSMVMSVDWIPTIPVIGNTLAVVTTWFMHNVMHEYMYPIMAWLVTTLGGTPPPCPF